MIQASLVFICNLEFRETDVNKSISGRSLNAHVHPCSFKPKTTQTPRKRKQSNQNRFHGRMTAVNDKIQRLSCFSTSRHASLISQDATNLRRRSHWRIRIDEPLPGVFILLKKIGTAELKPKHRKIYDVKFGRSRKVTKQEFRRFNEKVSRQSDQAFQRQFFASLMPHGPLTFPRAIRFHHQMARATNTSQPRHNILELKPARDNALFKRRRAGTIQELRGEPASRAKEFECRYVADADSHGTTLSGSHPSAKIEAKKVPRTQTETRHESNTFSQKRAKVRQTMTLQKLYLRRCWQSIPRRTKQSAGNYLLSQKDHGPLANANGPWSLRHMKQSRLMLTIGRTRGKAQLSSARRRSWKNKPAGVLDEPARWHVRRPGRERVGQPGRRHVRRAWSQARQASLAQRLLPDWTTAPATNGVGSTL